MQPLSAGVWTMGNEKITVFISIYKGFVEEVKAFSSHADAKKYYEQKVLESYDSLEQYEEEAEHGAKLEFNLFEADLS